MSRPGSPPSTLEGTLHLSTISVDDMVEIKSERQSPSPGPSRLPDPEDEGKCRLIYSKSKVYVNPTAYARDNIPGFVALVKREAVNPSYLLAWIPETLLNEKGQGEWDKFVKIEERPILDTEDDDAVLIELPLARPESYAFSVPLSSIYSLIVRPPSLSSWYVTEEKRQKAWEEKQQLYHNLKDEWWGVPEVFERQDVVEERHRIDVDCRRTDRTQPLFASTTPSSEESEDEKGMHMRFSTISPQFGDIGAQAPTNEHIERLGTILLTYNFYEKELGYVQGMSDLCAPIYVVMGADEEMTFWCFVEVMNRMKQNFLRDQSGMKKQLSTLQQLISVMDPELYRHLEKTDGLNLFFCFRWILISFKREFPFEDVLRMWEVLWTNYYSHSFVLFIALAILESHRDVILRYLVEFDEILKYCNELSMTIELDSTLAQAEVLFLSFAQLAADIDRRRAEEGVESSNDLRRRHGSGDDHSQQQQTGGREPEGAAKALASRLTLSDDLTDLLRT